MNTTNKPCSEKGAMPPLQWLFPLQGFPFGVEMQQHTEIIDGKEVTIKVYAPYKGPKKLTVKTKPKRSMKAQIGKGKRK